MRVHRLTSLVLLLPIVLAVTSCDEAPTAPVDPRTELDISEAGADYGPGDRRGGRLLQGLLRRAVLQVHQEQGADAARAILEPVRRYRDAARLAREAGDLEGVRSAVHAARLETARVITEVLGVAVVDRVLERARVVAVRIERRVEYALESGQDVTRAETISERLRSTLAEAEAAHAAGDFPLALERATRAGAMGMRCGNSPEVREGCRWR